MVSDPLPMEGRSLPKGGLVTSPGRRTSPEGTILDHTFVIGILYGIIHVISLVFLVSRTEKMQWK